MLSLAQEMTIFRKPHPYVFATCSTCFKMTAADFVAQKLIEGRTTGEINHNRIALFAILGFCRGGLAVGGGIFSHVVNDIILRSRRDWKLKALQITISGSIHAAFIDLPMFYALKSIVYNGWNVDLIEQNIIDYLTIHIYRDMYELVRLFGPAYIITFAFWPVQVWWITLASFVWFTRLSLTRGENISNAQTDDEPQTQTQPVTQARAADVARVASAIEVNGMDDDKTLMEDLNVHKEMNILANDDVVTK